MKNLPSVVGQDPNSSQVHIRNPTDLSRTRIVSQMHICAHTKPTENAFEKNAVPILY